MRAAAAATPVRRARYASSVSPGSGSRSWGRWPTASDGGRRRTTPRSGASRPASSRSSVDLPAPFGPTSPIRDPGGTTRSTSARTTWAPWDFVTPAAASVPTERMCTS